MNEKQGSVKLILVLPPNTVPSFRSSDLTWLGVRLSSTATFSDQFFSLDVEIEYSWDRLRIKFCYNWSEVHMPTIWKLYSLIQCRFIETLVDVWTNLTSDLKFTFVVLHNDKKKLLIATKNSVDVLEV